MRFRFIVAALLGVAGPASLADVTINPDSGGFRAKTSTYEAVVNDRGGLTALKVGKADFIEAKNSFSMGSYFYQDGGLALDPPAKTASDSVKAASAKGEASYTFADGSIEIKAKNLTAKTITYYLIVSRNSGAIKGVTGPAVASPITESWNQATWYQGESKLQITGFSRLWGPWDNGSQVVEITIETGQTATITLKPGAATAGEIAAAAKAVKPAKIEEADLNVYSPRPYQVFQRTALYKGQIIFAGRVRKPADKVVVRLSGRSLKGDLPDKWQRAELNKVDGSFMVKVATVPGGWYRAEVRALKGRASVADVTIENVGLGEVFVGAGQSNSTNSGQERIKQTSGMVSSFSGVDWRLADDPQPGTHDNSQGGSFWPAFGDAMYARYKVPIGVAVTGHGGTSVNQWQPGGELLNWMLARMAQLGIGGFRGVLWHQGESDVGMTSDYYAERMTNAIVESKRLAGWDFPWFVAQVSYLNAGQPKFDTTRNAQKMLWDKGVAFEGPDTDTLMGDNRDYNGAGIHFSPKGLRAHGAMWAEKVGAYLDKVLGIKR